MSETLFNILSHVFVFVVYLAPFTLFIIGRKMVQNNNHVQQCGHKKVTRRSPRLVNHYALNYPYVLIIIDMQDQFPASRDEMTIQTIQRLIIEAKRDGAFILAAHYMRFGKTRSEILDMIKNYSYKDYCYADQNDKSGAIYTKLIKHQIRSDTFKVCGVNTCACVHDTIYGLKDMYPTVHILVSNMSCNCNCDEQGNICDNHDIGQYSNVSFIH